MLDYLINKLFPKTYKRIISQTYEDGYKKGFENGKEKGFMDGLKASKVDCVHIGTHGMTIVKNGKDYEPNVIVQNPSVS